METRSENCMTITKIQINKSLQNFFNQQSMGNAIQHSVKAIFKMWTFGDTVALIKVYGDYYFSSLILNFTWEKHIFMLQREHVLV